MFRAPGDPATFRRYFARQVLAPIGVLIVVVLAAVTFGLYWSTSTSNDVSLQRQSRITQLALASAAEKVAYDQQGLAGWDQLGDQLARSEVDKKWLDIEIGGWLHDIFRHDMTFIIAGDGHVLYAFIDGKPANPTRFAAFADDLESIISASRNDPGETASAPRVEGHRKTTNIRADMTYRGYTTEIAGRPAAVSAMLVEAMPRGFASRKPILVSVRFLDGQFLRELAASSLTRGLRFSNQPVAARGETMVEFKDPLGKRIGYFFWRPELPGTRIVHVLAPATALIILLIFAALALLTRSLWRSGRQLSNAVIDLRASEAQAQHLAFHDVLTGLPNRALLQDRMEQALARARRGQPCAVLALDLDRFKQVNDSLGHAAGDTLIRQFASRLSSIVRATDTVARLGGDEFTILLCDASRREDVEHLCERVLAAVREPFELLGNRVFVGVSIGVVLVPEAGTDRSDLVRKADIALYRAKSEGRDCYRVFTASMDELVKLRSELEEELRRAVANGDELDVHYQPEVDADSQRIVGMEALLRWHHPTRGEIIPSQFIPIAEETGLISQLGDFVLTKACHMARQWPELFVAVNLSAVQFRSADLASRIIGIAKAAQCNPHQIELEITESVLLEEDDIACETLRALREAGFRIALDDFGTGYSSLSYLRQFKVDKIKIDRSFTQNLGQDHEAAAIVTSVVTLGHAMGLTVTAEGVENSSQVQLLHAAGCNELQGFLFSRALPGSAIADLLLGRAQLKDVA